jgi:cation transport protein ChaC
MTSPRSPDILTRDILLDGTLDRMVARSMPDIRLLTEDERRYSLDQVLAARPQGPCWLFAYGSLLWNPTVPVLETRPARVQGWHRSFCLSTRAGRGSPDNPGLVLGLDRGGACTGAGLRLPEDGLRDELALLWRREMLTGSYVPRWVRLLDRVRPATAGTPPAVFGHAIAFTMNRQSTQYCGRLDTVELVRRLATARGELGSSSDYLFGTRDGLRALGIRDPAVERLAASVSAWQGEAADAGPGEPGSV